MKKNLFFLAAAAIALASCSNDDVVDVNKGTGISFRASVGSRAIETTTGNLAGFNVTAFNGDAIYFKDVLFNSSESSGNKVYTSTSEYFWPSSGTLTFHAYAPINLIPTVANNGLSFDITPAAKISEQIDFITATATGTKDDQDTGVGLTFFHNLTQIEIQAKNTNTSYLYKVKGVRIGQVVSKGTFASTWTLGEEKTNYGVIYNNFITLGATETSIMDKNVDGSASTAMVLPQTLTAWKPGVTDDNGTYIAVLVNVKSSEGTQVFPIVETGATTTGDTYGWVAVPVDGTWTAGNKYVYTLNFSTGIGYIAPEQGGGNGENPGPGGEGDGGNGDDTIDPTPGGENPDPTKPIFGKPITFTATVTTWETEKVDKNMPNK